MDNGITSMRITATKMSKLRMMPCMSIVHCSAVRIFSASNHFLLSITACLLVIGDGCQPARPTIIDLVISVESKLIYHRLIRKLNLGH
jgi:hypothetical protein